MTPTLIHQSIALTPTSSLSCTLFSPPSPSTSPLVVFINGLLTNSYSWEPLIHNLSDLPTPPYILSYDRFNIPPSSDLPEDRQNNDIATAASDLAALLEKVYGLLELEDNTQLVLVGSSIGCCIIRMFTQNPENRFKVAGVLFLDSYISNTDFTSLFPLPTVDEPEALTRTREIISRRFHPSIGNPEYLSRVNVQQLLPSASSPKLPSNPVLVVMAHDAEYNADDMVLKLNIDKACYLKYVQSTWDTYNNSLVELSERGKLVIAKGSGHFIQQDRPDLVVKEIKGILEEI